MLKKYNQCYVSIIFCHTDKAIMRWVGQCHKATRAPRKMPDFGEIARLVFCRSNWKYDQLHIVLSRLTGFTHLRTKRLKVDLILEESASLFNKTRTVESRGVLRNGVEDAGSLRYRFEYGVRIFNVVGVPNRDHGYFSGVLAGICFLWF